MAKKMRRVKVMDDLEVSEYTSLVSLLQDLHAHLISAKQDLTLDWTCPEESSCAYVDGYYEREETDEEEAERERNEAVYANQALMRDKQLFEQLKQKHGW